MIFAEYEKLTKLSGLELNAEKNSYPSSELCTMGSHRVKFYKMNFTKLKFDLLKYLLKSEVKPCAKPTQKIEFLCPENHKILENIPVKIIP